MVFIFLFAISNILFSKQIYWESNYFYYHKIATLMFFKKRISNFCLSFTCISFISWFIFIQHPFLFCPILCYFFSPFFAAISLLLFYFFHPFVISHTIISVSDVFFCVFAQCLLFCVDGLLLLLSLCISPVFFVRVESSQHNTTTTSTNQTTYCPFRSYSHSYSLALALTHCMHLQTNTLALAHKNGGKHKQKENNKSDDWICFIFIEFWSFSAGCDGEVWRRGGGYFHLLKMP